MRFIHFDQLVDLLHGKFFLRSKGINAGVVFCKLCGVILLFPFFHGKDQHFAEVAEIFVSERINDKFRLSAL